MKRRGFLGGLAAALTTKPQIDAKALMGVETSGLSVAFGVPVGMAPDQPQSYISHLQSGLARQAVLRTLRPEWWIAEKRDESRVTSLDPDIAAMHSWSMAAKITAQRERNFKDRIESEDKWLNRNLQQALWREANK